MSTCTLERCRLLSTGYRPYGNLLFLIKYNGSTAWILRKCLEKKPDGNYISILLAVFTKSRKQHPTKQKLYGHLSLISQTIQVKRRHAGDYLKSRDELQSKVLLWTSTYGHTRIDRPAKTYIHQCWANTGCHLEDLLRERERDDIDRG